MNVLFRILGNDLPPRHVPGQTVKNVEYILKNEHQFEKTERVWILNRIVCPEQYYQLNKLLKGETVYEIPFIPSQYLAAENKIAYITNLNNARNLCLDIGASFGATLTLPLDGNCFFQKENFEWISLAAECLPYHGYFCIPMARSLSEELSEDFNENWGTDSQPYFGMSEPQLAFTPEYDLRFDPNLLYGNLSKAELLISLGVHGVWMNWMDPVRVSKFYGKVEIFPKVHRLFSGNPDAEKDVRTRARLRQEGLKNILSLAEEICNGPRAN